MTEAHRLLDCGTARERALLRAGVEEEPTRESRRQAALALGLAPSVAVWVHAVGKLVKTAKSSSILACSVVPATALAAGLYVVAHRSPGAVPMSVSIVSYPMSAPSFAGSSGVISEAASMPNSSSPLTPAPRSGRLPLASAPIPASPPLAPAPGAGHLPPALRLRETSDAVRRQVAMIDRARSLASAGQGDRAVDVLDEYGRRFPHGVLAEEAALVRLEITVRRGDGAGASALAQRFLTDYPHSVHGDRVRAWADAHFE